MSGRVVSQEAYRAARARESRLVIARGLATASTNHSNQASPSRGPRKRFVKEAKKKDDKLRHAINIFQMANFFFPTKAEEDDSSATSSSSLISPSSKESTSAKEGTRADADQKDELDETLDDHIRGTMMGTAQHVMFDSNVHMQTANAFLQAKIAQDRSQFASVYQQDSPNAEVPDWNQIWPPAGPPTARPLEFSRNTNANEDSLTESDVPPPPVEDRKALEKYIAEAVKRTQTASAMGARKQGMTNVDVRGAQVMDALYGTVGGQFPGLEVLKERIKERDEREKQQMAAHQQQRVKKKRQSGDS